MTRFREALGRRVITRDSADDIGKVTRFLLGGDARIGAITVGDMPSRGLGAVAPPFGAPVATEPPADPPIIIDWDRIVGFGGDAVIAPSADALREPGSDEERDAARGAHDLLDRPLLTDGGDMVGKIGDVEFDERTGELTGLVIGDEVLAMTRIVAVGPFAVIIATA